jgi:hypothetical protein
VTLPRFFLHFNGSFFFITFRLMGLSGLDWGWVAFESRSGWTLAETWSLVYCFELVFGGLSRWGTPSSLHLGSGRAQPLALVDGCGKKWLICTGIWGHSLTTLGNWRACPTVSPDFSFLQGSAENLYFPRGAFMPSSVLRLLGLAAKRAAATCAAAERVVAKLVAAMRVAAKRVAAKRAGQEETLPCFWFASPSRFFSAVLFLTAHSPAPRARYELRWGAPGCRLRAEKDGTRWHTQCVPTQRKPCLHTA